MMENAYLVSYSVKGIKNIDTLVTLSFYKKTIEKDLDVQNYNIKGIYGVNGSGKSGIIMSVKILKNLIWDSSYLNNPIIQKNLEEIVNKRTKELFIQLDYLMKMGKTVEYFRYEITLSKDENEKYVISHEQLLSRNAFSKKEEMETIFRISNGEIILLYEKEKENEISKTVYQKTMNLLSSSTMSSLFVEKIFKMFYDNDQGKNSLLFFKLAILCFLGKNLHVYMDESDNHREYVVRNSIEHPEDLKKYNTEINLMINRLWKPNNDFREVLSVSGNVVNKSMYQHFEKIVDGLFEFLHIFKPDLKKIEIEKKENKDVFICDLIMVYDSYKIHAEFESTGIKKLIRLFGYLKEMVQGGIVFIDELDSNLHDVYLCALLEYLMEYGEGQLCFTTHNVGPMDVLKQRKKSIDFLSEDHKIYSWRKNGNYSPSKLYRSGMIEGSPFNIDSIDFIGAFGLDGEDE